jgi:L-ribulose-5-phosphate 4-epimerase
MLGDLKASVFKANLDIRNEGLVVHTWGNVSGRDKESGLIVIKPSGISYASMRPSDMVVIDPEGKIVEGKLRPSTDAPTHIFLYNRFSSIGSIVHTHSSYATAWAQAGKDIPPLGTTHADHFYGEVPCTRELMNEEIKKDYELNTGKIIAERLGTSDPLAVPAVLVNGHGPFCWGLDAEDAVYNAVALEEIARIAFYTVLLEKQDSINRELIEKHFHRKHGKKAYYGQFKTK